MGLIRPSLASSFIARPSRTASSYTVRLPSTSFARRASPPASRPLSSTPSRRYQHVLYLGDVLGYTSVDRLSKFPRAWLDSVGVANDVDRGLRFTALQAGAHHLLLAYTLVDPPMAGRGAARREDVVLPGGQVEAEAEDEGEVIEIQGKPATSAQPSKVFSLGRNTHAQLGLGFASQEATRGMVTGHLHGQAGVTHVVAGGACSFVVTAKEGGESNVFGFGNDTLGQLGAYPPTESFSTAGGAGGDLYDIATRLSDSGAPQLKLLPLPKSVDLGEGGWKVKSAAAGLDHSLVLVEREVSGWTVQRVVSTGLNTDGQLGVTPKEGEGKVPIEPLLSRSFQPVPLELEAYRVGEENGNAVSEVVCGADTSYALTEAGDLWVWGNSEYGQSFAGVHDRIVAPVFVPNPLPAAYDANGLAYEELPKVQKLVAGGSFAAILDTDGRVWVIGYGPRAGNDGPDEQLALITGWPSDAKIENLFCGLEYLVAVTGGEQVQVLIWGIAPRSISTLPIVTPTRIPFSIPKTPRQTWLDENPRLKKQEEEVATKREVRVEAAACTRDHLLLILNDGQGRDVWAECDQPPRDKGTDVV